MWCEHNILQANRLHIISIVTMRKGYVVVKEYQQ